MPRPWRIDGERVIGRWIHSASRRLDRIQRVFRRISKAIRKTMKPVKRMRRLLVRAAPSTSRPSGKGTKRQEEITDLREVTENPVEALYVSRAPSFVINVPLGRCRGFGVSPSNLGTVGNPFVRATRHIMETGCDDFATSPLADYYNGFQPASAAAVLGLANGSRMADYPPLAAVLPWHVSTPAERHKLMRGSIEQYWRRHGIDLNADDGVTEYGPVSLKKGAREITRLLDVYKSISAQGFRRDHGDLYATLLIGSDDGEWACQITDGIHRVAVMVALGYSCAPVRVIAEGTMSAVRRADVNAWPHVRSGLLSRDEALAVFDKLLRGV